MPGRSTPLIFFLLFSAGIADAQNIETIAGTGAGGYSGDDGPATNAQLLWPTDVAIDKDGNVYIADHENYRIRKIDKNTGIITTVIGTGVPGYSGDNGSATEARIDHPHGMTIDKYGNIFIADTYNHCIRKITKSTGIITTIAGTGFDGYSGDGGPAMEAQLSSPYGITVDTVGNIYIADRNNNCIRKVTVATGNISTIAGTGVGGFSGDEVPASEAELYHPSDVCLDKNENLYIADYRNHRIRKVDKVTGIISTIAGTGTPGFSGDTGIATGAQLNYPIGVTIDAVENIYIAEYVNHCVRKINASAGIITSIAGTGVEGYSGDGDVAMNAKLSYPSAVETDAFCSVYIVDYLNNRIRKITNLAPALAVSESVTLCEGNSTNLTASGAGNYIWQPSEGLSIINDSSVTAQANITTTYSVSGCYSNIATVTVTIDVVSANAGNDVAICAGNAAQLNAVGGEAQYEWSPEYALSATTGASVSAEPTLTTNYSLTVTNEIGCVGRDEITVSVAASLTSNAGSDGSICQGNSTTLNGSGGVDYHWSPAEGLDNTSIYNPTANPTSTTTYTLEALSGNCSTIADYVTVAVSPFIDLSISGNDSICPGDSTSLTVAGAIICSWSPASGLNSITGANVMASPTSGITYSVSASNSCGSHIKEFILQLRSNPSVSISGTKIICKGDTSILTASGADTYSWYPATDLNTTTGAIVYASPTVNTPYFVTGTDIYGCESTKHISIVVDPCTGIDENNFSSSFVIYPNPNDGRFIVQMDAQQESDYELKIFNVIGNFIFNFVIPAQAGISPIQEEIDLSNEAKGIYFISIYNESGQVGMKKIVLR